MSIIKAHILIFCLSAPFLIYQDIIYYQKQAATNIIDRNLSAAVVTPPRGIADLQTNMQQLHTEIIDSRLQELQHDEFKAGFESFKATRANALTKMYRQESRSNNQQQLADTTSSHPSLDSPTHSLSSTHTLLPQNDEVKPPSRAAAAPLSSESVSSIYGATMRQSNPSAETIESIPLEAQIKNELEQIKFDDIKSKFELKKKIFSIVNQLSPPHDNASNHDLKRMQSIRKLIDAKSQKNENQKLRQANPKRFSWIRKRAKLAINRVTTFTKAAVKKDDDKPMNAADIEQIVQSITTADIKKILQ